MRVTVVGSSCSIPRSGRACSSYLVEDRDVAISLDYGTGAFASMRRHTDYDRLDAIVISHMHADHFLDLIPLRYAIRYGNRRVGRMPLWMPPGGVAMLRSLVAAFASEGSGDFIDDVFDIREYDPDTPLEIGGGRLRFARTTHFVPSYAVRYERGEQSITYSADTAPDDRVVTLARGTDLFLCEATLREHDVEEGPRGHCSAAEAAGMAQSAGAKRLALTHYSEEATDVDLAASARTIFTGEVLVADDHAVLQI